MVNFLDKASSPQEPTNYPEALKSLLEDFTALLGTGGVSISSHTSESLSKYETYPASLQKKIYDDFVKYHSAVKDIMNSGTMFSNTKQSLWRLFTKFDLKPTSDLFSIIEDTDVVEIYLSDNVQWYRSSNYFDYTSYSIGELIIYPWTELIEHGSDHSSHFAEIAGQIFSNKLKESVFLNLGPCISRERFSQKRYVAQLDPKVLSPIMLRTEDINVGLVVVWKIRLLHEPLKTPGQAKTIEI